MEEPARVRRDLGAVVAGAPTALAAADRLCEACVDLLDVDGASISLVRDGATRGTVGSSSASSRRLDGLQLTYGEGPCLDAVSRGRPVLVAELGAREEVRWPASTPALLASGISAVFALPVALTSTWVGAPDLFRARRGSLTAESLAAGLRAAQLAALPLLDLMSGPADVGAAGEGGDGWEQLATLERVEVHQATGMVVAALDVDAVEALVRLRAHAAGRGITASEAAWDVVERRVDLDGEDWRGGADGRGTR